MGFNIDTAGGVKEGNDNSFAPLAAGKYQVTVFDTKAGEYKEGGVNAGRPNLNVQFRIADGQKGANRRVFQTVGLFLNWNPKPGDKEGKDNFLFYQFFGALRGESDKDFRAKVKEVGVEKLGDLLPEPDTILGKQLTLTLGIESDTYAFNKAKTTDPSAKAEDFKRNNIKAITPPGEIVAGAAEGNGDLDTTTAVVL